MDIKDNLYQARLIFDYVTKVFPIVDNEVNDYMALAKNIPDFELQRQALNSIETKKFHCIGGSVYALYPSVDKKNMVHFVTAYQTISDYLDNLCDRAGEYDEMAFRQLHKAMTDALDPESELVDYYKYYPYKDDGGYLNYLVTQCKNYIEMLPSYDVIKNDVLYLAQLYSDLQVYKHISLEAREKKMRQWFNEYISEHPDINGWEFSAATGSTLGVFMLAALAHKADLGQEEVEDVLKVYFPWICGLHILLDYYIDLYEDIEEGDLNFVSYYETNEKCEERLSYFLTNALQRSMKLKYPLFHRTIVEGLIAMYLSDPKAKINAHKEITRRLIKKAGSFAGLLYYICLGLRKASKL